MKKANRTFALVLALVLMLSLAACGGGNDTPSGNNTPLPSPTQTQDPTPTEPDNGGNTTAPSLDPDPTSGANNPLYDLPAGFETHAHDGEYFYATTDDYLVSVTRYTGANNATTFQGGQYGNVVTHYAAYNFVNGEATGYFSKWIFENEDYAKQYAAAREDNIAVGNMVYRDPDSGAMLSFTGKQDIINDQESRVSSVGGEVYLSKSSGQTTPGTSGGVFFPGIDDSLLPDDIVKMMVGTLEAATYDGAYAPSYITIELRFTGVTENDFSELKAHYTTVGKSVSSFPTFEGIEFDWGIIQVYFNEGVIDVIIAYGSQYDS